MEVNNIRQYGPNNLDAGVLNVPEGRFKMNRKTIYWVSQLSGWISFVFLNLIIIATFDKLNLSRFVVFGSLVVTGIFLTHIYKIIIKKREWINLPFKKLIPRVLLSSIVIGSLMNVTALLISFQAGWNDPSKFKFGMVAMGTFNLSGVILLWSLIYFLVHYFENYKKVEIESYIWEAAVKDFELKTLKSQLNPHFMFNALNSIRALIQEDPQNAQIAVTKLSNILRYSLKIERSESVPLEEEMQTVADYLALESIRFEERLKYKINIDPKSAKIEIPPMMIQTLVENGIKHGVSKRKEGGAICIDSIIKDSRLHIEIKNTGRIKDEDLKNSKGFGINNTKHRLNLIYGEDASFSIKNKAEDQVIAEIVIPTGGIKNESFNR
ncbi:MAG TPA: histidine kinase [Ignavibacteriaceae bacterium]|nr:histidine kinase [Ignavibacteriaceae bacterium]